MAALPKALARRGHRVMVVAPRYEPYAEGWETGTRLKIRVFDQEHEVRWAARLSLFQSEQVEAVAAVSCLSVFWAVV